MWADWVPVAEAGGTMLCCQDCYPLLHLPGNLGSSPQWLWALEARTMSHSLCLRPSVPTQGLFRANRLTAGIERWEWGSHEEPQWDLCVKGWDCPLGWWGRHGLWWLNSTWLILSASFFFFNLIGLQIPRIGLCYQTKPIPSPVKTVSLLRMSCKTLKHLFTH